MKRWLSLLLACWVATSAWAVVDVSPPFFRKIGLDGHPILDSAPHQRLSKDGEPEGTYVDVFSGALHHATSDFFLPFPRKSFALQVRRNWVHGDEAALPRPDRPFGLGWSTSLAPSVHTIENQPLITVTDDEGVAHSFVQQTNAQGEAVWSAIPSSTSHQEVHLFELKRERRWVLRKTHGTTLVYGEYSPVEVRRGEQVHRFYRLLEVSDAFGGRMDYFYYSGNHSLVPNEIAYRGRRIRIQRNAQGLVSAILDGRTAIVRYEYEDTDKPFPRLKQVQRLGLPVATYEIELKSTLPEKPAQARLNALADGKARSYRLRYEEQDGLRLTRIELPTQTGEVLLRTRITPETLHAMVVDAEGHGRWYRFSGIQVGTHPLLNGISTLPLRTYQTLDIEFFHGSTGQWKGNRFVPQGGTRSLAVQRYRFDATTSMNLTSAIDAHGNVYTFQYLQAKNSTPTAPLWTRRVVRFENPLSETWSFEYNDEHQLVSEVNPLGHTRVWDWEQGRIIAETLFATPQRNETRSRQEFTYQDTHNRDAVTQHIRRRIASESSPKWEQDLVTQFRYDHWGRETHRITDPSELRMTRLRRYDANNRISEQTEEDGTTFLFQYDSFDRLTLVSQRHLKELIPLRWYGYDTLGNRVQEMLFDGTKTQWTYDAMNRPVREEVFDDIEATEPVTVSTWEYNRLGSVLVDPQGNRKEWDGLQRLTRQTTAEGVHTDWLYGKNSGHTLFDGYSFHPTQERTGNRLTTTQRNALAQPVNQKQWNNRWLFWNVQTTKSFYDKLGQLIRQDINGNEVHTWEYDVHGNMILQTRPGGLHRKSAYSSTGLLIMESDWIGFRRTYEYDPAGRRRE